MPRGWFLRSQPAGVTLLNVYYAKKDASAPAERACIGSATVIDEVTI